MINITLLLFRKMWHICLDLGFLLALFVIGVWKDFMGLLLSLLLVCG